MHSNYCIIISGGSARALFHISGSFYIFDSHSINVIGEGVENGAATVFGFSTFEEMVDKIYYIINFGYNPTNQSLKDGYEQDLFTLDPIRVIFPEDPSFEDKQFTTLEIGDYESYNRRYFQEQEEAEKGISDC